MDKSLYTVLKTMAKICFPSIPEPGLIIGRLLKRMQHLIKHNGTLFTVKYIKEARLHVTRFYAGQPLLVSPLKVSLDKEGFPLLFKDLKELLGGSLEKRKFVFTLLMISRTLQAKKKEKIPVLLDSITDPKKGTLSILSAPVLRYVIKELKLDNLLPLP